MGRTGPGAPHRSRGKCVLTPFVASRSTDQGVSHSELTIGDGANGPQLAYRNMRPEDRDKHGNLWVRVHDRPGGRVLYDSMHPLRQRLCMEGMLCQICAGPADRNKDGWLFIDWLREDSPPTWPERSVTAMPPPVRRARTGIGRTVPALAPRSVRRAPRAQTPPLRGVGGPLPAHRERVGHLRTRPALPVQQAPLPRHARDPSPPGAARCDGRSAPLNRNTRPAGTPGPAGCAGLSRSASSSGAGHRTRCPRGRAAPPRWRPAPARSPCAVRRAR